MRTRTAPWDYERFRQPDLYLDGHCPVCGRPTENNRLCYPHFKEEYLRQKEEAEAFLRLDEWVKAAILEADPQGEPADMALDGYETPMQTRASLGV